MWERDTVLWSIDDINSKNKAGLLTKPPYQRGLIWPDAMKRRLIWCILGDQDINKIYLRAYQASKRSPLSYDIVDGQQRLNAILGFSDGQFSFNRAKGIAPINGVKVAGMSYKQLPDELASQFVNYQVSVCVIRTDDTDKLISQFMDLQSARILSSQDKREAFNSILSSEIRTLAENHPLMNEIRFARTANSGADRDFVARLVFYEFSGGIALANAPALTRMYIEARIGKRTSEEIHLAVARVQETMQIMFSVVCHLNCTLFATHARVLYWVIKRVHSAEKRLSPARIRELCTWYGEFYQETIAPNLASWSTATDQSTAITARVEIALQDLYRWTTNERSTYRKLPAASEEAAA